LRLKILKKLRTASFNSEFTGSYKKKCSAFVFNCFILFRFTVDELGLVLNVWKYEFSY